MAPTLRRLLQDVEDLDDEVVLPMLQHVLEHDDVAGRHAQKKLPARYVRLLQRGTLDRRSVLDRHQVDARVRDAEEVHV